MKKLRLLLLFGATVFALSGCADYDEIDPQIAGGLEVRISGGINQQPTRATAEGFVDGDAVGIYVVNYQGAQPGPLLDQGNQADYAQYTYDEKANKWVAMGKVYYKDDKTPVDLYGYYPYAKPATVSAYPFEVKQDQSTFSESGKLSGYEASDFLWGKAANNLPSTNAIKIAFNHRMACALVVLQAGTGFAEGEFERVERSVLMTGVTRKSVIDLATGVVTAQGTAATTGTVMNETSDGFRAIAIPQSVSASTPLFAITLDGIVYNFKKSDAFEFPAGEMSRFTITINKKEITGTYELVLSDISIIPWIEDSESHAGEARQYYVVQVQTPGTLEATLTALNKNGAKIKNLKVTGTIDARDFFYMRDKMLVLQALNLKEVKIVGYESYPANEIPGKALIEKKTLYFFAFPDGITKIGDYAFSGGSAVGGNPITGHLVIPDGVTEIGENAFAKCTNLTGLSLPSSLKKIGGHAFYNCSNLTGNLALPYGLEEIGASAFYDCLRFTGTLELPATLTKIGSSAFRSCRGFTGSLKIPEKVTVLKGQSFAYCSGMRGQLMLHDNVVFGGEGVFSDTPFTGELVLPKGLTTIPAETFGGPFGGSLFSSIAGFPEGLTEIGDRAFMGCWRLAGVLEFPKDLTSIGQEAFSGCKNLEGVVLPEHLSIIKANAFKDCFYINSIISKALVPPVAIATAFDGVPKNNFTVEVPEMAVNRYQTADEWSLFKRISANRNFSIERRFTRWLNAGGSKTIYLKALEGAQWSVDSKPDWVTVTPSTGAGKIEVTLTTSELTKGSRMRTGEVVFRLTGTDYTVKTTVEQYNYTHGDGDVVTLKRATKGKGVNIVVMGDCYDAKDISEGGYLKDITDACNHIFTVEPYKTYADYFNVYGVFGLSDDSGVGTINNEKNAKFGSQYFVTHGVKPDEAICFEYACKAPINNNVSETVVVLVPNTTIYAGITYMWGDGSAIAVCPKSEDAYPFDFRGLVQHEVGGHAFAKLADEYIYVHNWVDQCTCDNPHDGDLRAGKSRGWYRNLALTSDLRSVDWSHLIFHPTYSNIVDVFEGGWFHTKNVWRSEPNSCMNNNIPYFNAISRQEIVERLKKLAGERFDIKDFYAKDVLYVNPATRNTMPATVPTPYVSSQQYPPKYMGEKPNFNPNN